MLRRTAAHRRALQIRIMQLSGWVKVAKIATYFDGRERPLALAMEINWRNYADGLYGPIMSDDAKCAALAIYFWIDSINQNPI